MATGRSLHLINQIGEYLVSAELCRRGLISTTFTGDVPDFDFLETNKKLKKIPIQVKTITQGSWQFDARKYLDISISNGIQEVKGKKQLDEWESKLIFVFVRLVGQNKDEFYICLATELQDIIYENYTRWLSKNNGRRPRNPNSTHCTVSPDDLRKYKDNWEKIKFESYFTIK